MKIKYSKVIVILIIILAYWFTKQVLKSFEVTGTEPETLIKSFFALVVGELWLLAGIKKKELNKENENQNYNERM